jgi:predicted MFS family arabinose efflux permease
MLGGYVARIVGPDRVGRALTITSAGGVVATLFAVPAGTALSTVIGWRGAFGVLAAVGVLVAAAAGRVLPNLPGRPAAGAPRLFAVLKTPGLAGLIGTTIAVILAHFSFYTYIAPFLLRSGIAESRLGPALLVYGAMGAVGLFIAGLVIDRHLRGAMVASTAALVAVFVLLLAFGRTTVPAVVLGALTGAVMGCLPIFMQAVVVRLAPHAVETASALNASAFNAGIGGGALLGGIIVDRLNVGILPAVSAVLASIALAVVATDRRVGRHADPTLAPAALSPAGQGEVVAT